MADSLEGKVAVITGGAQGVEPARDRSGSGLSLEYSLEFHHWRGTVCGRRYGADWLIVADMLRNVTPIGSPWRLRTRDWTRVITRSVLRRSKPR
jgi:hypothetical protein